MLGRSACKVWKVIIPSDVIIFPVHFTKSMKQSITCGILSQKKYAKLCN